MQESELQQSAKKAQEAMSLAAEESAKCKAAKEVIKSLTAQVMFGSRCYILHMHIIVIFVIEVIYVHLGISPTSKK